ncbi:MAG TPA: hypothetical protein VLA00_03515 [Xanthobacteraceae bacterium]|nr:hypothetical protein [Xanthobacteraceae bacterium]
MWFLAAELWPYLFAALAIGVATGWYGARGAAAGPPLADAPERDAA